MNPTEQLERDLTAWMVANSRLDSHRPYIGLSKAWECPRRIYDDYHNIVATDPSREMVLRTFYSYQLEDLIMGWLASKFGDRVKHPGPDISRFEGLLQGHTDGMWGRDLVEVKTVPLSQHIPDTWKRLPQRVFYQVQAYLHYTKIKYCQVIYFARDCGAVRVFGIPYNPGRGEQIEAKFNRLVWAVRSKDRPECECGRCPVWPRD